MTSTVTVRPALTQNRRPALSNQSTLPTTMLYRLKEQGYIMTAANPLAPVQATPPAPSATPLTADVKVPVSLVSPSAPPAPPADVQSPASAAPTSSSSGTGCSPSIKAVGSVNLSSAPGATSTTPAGAICNLGDKVQEVIDKFRQDCVLGAGWGQVLIESCAA